MVIGRTGKLQSFDAQSMFNFPITSVNWAHNHTEAQQSTSIQSNTDGFSFHQKL